MTEPSFPRRRESSKINGLWIPAFAGMTGYAKVSIWKFIVTYVVLMGLFMGSRRLLKQSRVKK